jgi:hypothetical protein
MNHTFTKKMFRCRLFLLQRNLDEMEKFVFKDLNERDIKTIYVDV